MAWELLFGSDHGLMTLFTTGFVLVIAVAMGRFYTRRMDEEAED